MGIKAKYSKEVKVKACKDYLSGKKSAFQIAAEINPLSKGVDNRIRKWVHMYEAYGAEAFNEKNTNSSYTEGFKLQAKVKGMTPNIVRYHSF